MKEPKYSLGHVFDQIEEECQKLKGGNKRNALRRLNLHKKRYMESMQEALNSIPDTDVNIGDLALHIWTIEKAFIKGLANDFLSSIDLDWELRKRQLVEIVMKIRDDFYRNQLTDEENELRDKSSKIRVEIMNSVKKGEDHEVVYRKYMEEVVRFTTEWNEVITDPDRQAIIPDLNDPEDRMKLRAELHHHIRDHMIGQINPNTIDSIDIIRPMMYERIQPLIENNLHKSDEELLEDCMIECALIVNDVNAKYNTDHPVPELNDQFYRDMFTHNIGVSRRAASK